jgi:hypothetical protein
VVPAACGDVPGEASPGVPAFAFWPSLVQAAVQAAGGVDATSCCETGSEGEPAHLHRGGQRSESSIAQWVASTPSPVCTRVCTSEGENVNAGTLDASSPGTSPQAVEPFDADQDSKSEGTDQADPLAALAAAIAGLTPADRDRLAAMLLKTQGGNA